MWLYEMIFMDIWMYGWMDGWIVRQTSFKIYGTGPFYFWNSKLNNYRFLRMGLELPNLNNTEMKRNTEALWSIRALVQTVKS